MLNYEFPPIGGGGSSVTFELSRHLVLRGHKVDVVTMRYRNLAVFERIEGIHLYRTPALRRRRDLCHTHEMASYLLGALPKVFELIRHHSYDVVHAHFIIPTGPLAWLASRLAGVPFLITSHGSDVPGHNPTRFTLAHKLLFPFWRCIVKRNAMIISPSESHKQHILQLAPESHVQVISNGIDIERFAPVAKEKKILMCSRLLDFKGFQYALEAIGEMELDWRVEVIGDGPFLPELQALAKESKTPITFTGWLDRDDPRLKQSFETSSIFIFPSESENFPTVLLEAMAAGMAIITSTAGGCPEVVGDAALLVPPRNSLAIREQLDKLLRSDDLRRKLSQAALRQVRKFSWESVSQQYLDCYRSVI